jgi:hypothetical protein
MNFDYKKMPVMRPIPIKTKEKGFFGAIFLWLIASRKWVIEEDWDFTLNGVEYIIPKGFVFDGASVPKYFRSWLSPMGVLLIAGLVHDYGYKHARLQWKFDSFPDPHVYTQKHFDVMFRDIAIEVNGFTIINYIAYYALRLCGWWAWNSHRRRDEK